MVRWLDIDSPAARGTLKALTALMQPDLGDIVWVSLRALLLQKWDDSCDGGGTLRESYLPTLLKSTEVVAPPTSFREVTPSRNCTLHWSGALASQALGPPGGLLTFLPYLNFPPKRQAVGEHQCPMTSLTGIFYKVERHLHALGNVI